jgi:hypothetical protein
MKWCDDNRDVQGKEKPRQDQVGFGLVSSFAILSCKSDLTTSSIFTTVYANYRQHFETLGVKLQT